MQRLLALTAAACLLAAPIALAQTPPPAPTQQQPQPQPQPAPPPTNPAPAPTPSPAPAPTPAPQAQTPAPSAEPEGCRTRQEAGQPCACLSAPDRIGTSTTNAAGQNICVRPD